MSPHAMRDLVFCRRTELQPFQALRIGVEEIGEECCFEESAEDDPDPEFPSSLLRDEQSDGARDQERNQKVSLNCQREIAEGEHPGPHHPRDDTCDEEQDLLG